MAIGRSVVVDPATSGGCLVLPASASAASEYVVALVSGAGLVVPTGIAGSYSWRAAPWEENGAIALRSAVSEPAQGPTRAVQFHGMLRARERAAASRPRSPQVRRALRAPEVGTARTFQVCASLSCDAYVPVRATARFVGRRIALFVDDTIPPGGLARTDLAELGALFDDYLHPIDTLAFGRESDLDGDGVVAVLLTDAVNALSGDCSDGSVVLGYFLGSDLVPGSPGSNGGEVFYSRVPSGAAPACRHDRSSVLRSLPPTFIHEFQHMISFNQHVLLRGGAPEATWLNEALSHYAEELGGRFIPDGPVQGGAPTRQSQFLTANLTNALDYLADTEAHFLVTPGASFGTPAERGAAWLFVRWLSDHFGRDEVRGTALTRALVGTSDAGAVNVAARVGVSFDRLVAEWQLANYLDDLPGYAAAEDRLQYRTVNLRTSLAPLFPRYPVDPDSTAGTSYRRDGVLRAGSGGHLRVVIPAGGRSAALIVAGASEGGVDPLVAARVAVARVR